MTATARPIRGWRRIAVASWKSPNDPQIYGSLELDAAPLLAFIEQARATGHRVTPTHLVGRAVAFALQEAPGANVRLQGDRFVERPSIDIFYITAVEHGEGLSGVKVEHAEGKSAIETALELDERAGALRRGEDPEFSRTERITDALPIFALRILLHALSWLVGQRGLRVPGLSLSATPFGSAMVTSVGMFGLPSGFAPISWMYNVPILVLVGEIADRPVAVDGRVEVRPMIPISVTFDHRYLDGAHVGTLLKAFRRYVSDPESHEPPLPKTAAAG